jgi:Mg-chelatase subunit ChlD
MLGIIKNITGTELEEQLPVLVVISDGMITDSQELSIT